MSNPCNCCLPQELVVVKVFSAKSGDGNTVLDLQDRVRSMAVCKAWRSYLDPRRWPIQECCLDARNAKLAEWLFQIKPEVHKILIFYIHGDDSSMDLEVDSNLQQLHSTVINNVLLSATPRAALVELELYCDPYLVEDSLLGSFSNLTYLHLSGHEFEDATCSELLCSLPMLARLHVTHWANVELLPLPATVGASSPLPNLQHLEVFIIQVLVLDVTLPRLQTLDVGGVVKVEVGGEHLQLPALTRLSLADDFEDYNPVQLEVDMDQLTALQELSLGTTALPFLDGLDPLHRLTSLQLDCYTPEEQVAAGQLLRSVPKSLQQLTVEVLHWEDGNQVLGALEPSLAAALCASTHLTTLTLRASGPLPAQLGALSRLQALRLSIRPEDLTSREMMRLGWLRQLRHLVLAASQVEAGEEAMVQGALKLLKSALPTSCLVELE